MSHHNSDGARRSLETWEGKKAILNTWEKLGSTQLQIKERKYLGALRSRVRVAFNRSVNATRNTQMSRDEN